MAEIVNLRQARKARNRAEARTRADANALDHGRSKSAKALDAAEIRLARARLDAHRRDRADDGTDSDAPP